MLLCLGLDYKRGGFVDRALEAFNEVLRLDPKNEYALLNLQKLHEEQHQWTEAYDTRQRLDEARRHRRRGRRARRFSRFSKTRSASRRCGGRTTPKRSGGSRPRSISTRRAVPAYLNLGDVRVAAGQRARGRARSGRRSIEVAPDRAYLAFDRLEALAVRTGNPERFTRLCRRLIDENPQDWRARLALSRHLAAQRPAARGARPAVRGARAESARARHPPGDLARARPAAPPAGARRSLQRADASTPSSTSIRTSACAAATAAPSCSGSARTATTGTRSSKSASRRRRTRPKSRSEPPATGRIVPKHENTEEGLLSSLRVFECSSVRVFEWSSVRVFRRVPVPVVSVPAMPSA